MVTKEMDVSKRAVPAVNAKLVALTDIVEIGICQTALEVQLIQLKERREGKDGVPA